MSTALELPLLKNYDDEKYTLNTVSSKNNDNSHNNNNNNYEGAYSPIRPHEIQISINQQKTIGSVLGSKMGGLSPEFSRDRRPTELFVPDCVKFIRQRSKNEIDSNKSTISLSRDIFTTIAVLKAYGIWKDLSYRHRRQIFILALICVTLQFGLLFTLTVETIVSPPWEDENFEIDGVSFEIMENFLVIITKFWCLMAVLIYLFKELYEFKAYRKLREEISDFRTTCSKMLFHLYNIYNISLYIISMALSVVLISTSNNGFEAVLNAVAILFVLDIDNWIYQMIKSNHFIEDELYDIKYTKHQEMTSYLIAKYQWMASCCPFCQCRISSYLHKAQGDEAFISLIALFVWFAMILSMSLICLWLVYDDPFFGLVGGISLCVVGAYYLSRHGFNTIGSCCFRMKNKTKIDDFVTEELPRICHKFIKEMDKEMNKEKNTQRINEIKQEYVEECFRYFDRNTCGVRETRFETTEKFITAFDEYYTKCDKSKIQITDLDIGAYALGIRFKL